MSTLPLGRPTRSNAGKRKRDDGFTDSSTLSAAVLNERVVKKAKVLAPPQQVVGRCGSAPPPLWIPPKNSGQTIFPDVTKTTIADAWGDPNKKGIRLVYPNLVSKGGNFQGIFIPDNAITSSTDMELHKHLEAVKDSMLTKQNANQITEATGEAATALAMRRRFPKARMRWGMHVHSGPGIDQIWVEPSATWPTYYIVEAKGVGAGLTYKNIGPPPEIKQQMSLGWVLDNLVRMSRQISEEFDIASEVLEEMGLEEVNGKKGGAYYANFEGASKSYYACSFNPKLQTASLLGVVVNAIWNPSGLSYVVSNIYDYGDQLPYSPAIKD